MSDFSEAGSPERTELRTDFLSIDDRSQSINIAIYVGATWLQYLAAPVLYVGITQAALCHELGGSAAISNLPNSASFWMTALPVAAALIGTSFMLVLFYLPARVTPISTLAGAELTDPAARTVSAHNEKSRTTS